MSASKAADSNTHGCKIQMTDACCPATDIWATREITSENSEAVPKSAIQTPDSPRPAHARVEKLSYRAESAAKTIAGEAARRAPDLVIAPLRGDDLYLAEAALAAGNHHLLLVPGPAETPNRLLICVAVGEPGNEDVGFTGRLARHLGAEATILTVLPAAEGAGMARALAERFLAASARTLGRMGVPAKTAIRQGGAARGDPRRARRGRARPPRPRRPASAAGRVRLTGVVAHLLAEAAKPVLIVRPPRGAI